MYFKKKDNSIDSEQYLKQDGTWSCFVMILDGHLSEVRNCKMETHFMQEYQNEEFEPCSKSEFEIGFKKAMSILKSQIL